MQDKFETSFNRLRAYCEKEEFKGWDPFDGLNSKVFENLYLLNRNKYVKLAWIQAFKKNPINLRRLLLVKKDVNPKGIGLFLNGYCNMYRTSPDPVILERINSLAEMIISLITPGFSGSCWGYNFDWQSLAFFQPKYTPTIVASTFIGYALLDAFDITGHELYRDHALSVCDFILKDLNRTFDQEGDFAFSYSPSDTTQVFNASLLGSRMLSRAFRYTNNPDYLKEARKSVAFCCKHQHPDGSWPYSPLSFHSWIDNFHTGYNLECIAEYQKYSGDHTFKGNISKGLEYYIQTFFLPEGIPKYYNNAVYPIDVHAPSQLVITMSRLGKLQQYQRVVDSVLAWTIENLQDEKGYFYFQQNRWYTIKIPYMRWSQAWIFYALSEYLLMRQHENKNAH
jgi:hypothetical protein